MAFQSLKPCVSNIVESSKFYATDCTRRRHVIGSPSNRGRRRWRRRRRTLMIQIQVSIGFNQYKKDMHEGR